MAPLGTSEIWGFSLNDDDAALPPEVDARFTGEHSYETVNDITWEYCPVEGGVAVTACLGEYLSIDVPAHLDGRPVVCIGPRCFANRRMLYAVGLPDSIVEICDYAFMFSGIAEFVAPPRLGRIGKRAFFRCWQLTSACLGDCLAEIGDEAFCLTQVSALDIPRSVRHIGKSALSNSPVAHAPGFKTLRIEEGSPYFLDELGGLYKRGARGLVFINFMNVQAREYTVQDDTVEVAAKAFAHCKELESAYLPDGLRAISTAAFSGCRKLSDVRLPASLECIGDAAFKNCSLGTFAIPASLREMGDDVFAVKYNEIYQVTTLHRVTVEEGNRRFYVEGGMLCKRGEPGSGDTVLLYFGRGGSVAIPEAVTHIAANAFVGQSRVTRIVLHDHIEEVGERGLAFKSGIAEEVFLGAGPDGTDVTVRFPSCTAGVAAARSCFKEGTVDARRAQLYADKALLREEDRAERFLLMCRRLAEPLWLDAEIEQSFYNELDEFIGEVGAALASGDYLDGYMVLASRGLLTQDRFETVMEAVSATGEAKAVTHLLELRRRLWSADRPDFEL